MTSGGACFFCTDYEERLAWLIFYRHLAFRMPKSRKMKLAPTGLAEKYSQALLLVYLWSLWCQTLWYLMTPGHYLWTNKTTSLYLRASGRKMSPAVHNLLKSAAEGPESLETTLYQVIKDSTGNRLYLFLKPSFSFVPQLYFPRVCNSGVLILDTWLSFTETVNKNMRLTTSFWMWESATNYFLKVIWTTPSSW